MERYDSKQEWTNVENNTSKLLGFQQVLSNKDKVFLWFRELQSTRHNGSGDGIPTIPCDAFSSQDKLVILAWTAPDLVDDMT